MKANIKDSYSEINNINNNINNNLADKQNIIKENDLKLHSTWTLWHASRKEELHHIKYSDRLTEIANISSLYSFFSSYLYLKSIDEIKRNNDIALFKNKRIPTWEHCRNSACWFVRFKRQDNCSEIELIWEKLVFGIIGEQFNEENMLGCILSIRGRETIIEVWFVYDNNNNRKVNVVSRMKDICQLSNSTIVYFKDNEKSIKENSTLRNAEMYVCDVK